MDRGRALEHLKIPCVPSPSATDATLEADWRAAQAALGPATASAGQPAMTPIPLNHSHLQALIAQQWAMPMITTWLGAGASFQMVEVDRLLAFQHTVDTDRSRHHCAALSFPPTEAELFRLCLPIQLSSDDVHHSQNGSSIVLRSKSLNFGIDKPDGFIPNTPYVGIRLAWRPAMVHVARYNGRCYLANGFHRCFGARVAGATEVPCIFRDVASPADAGIQPPGTFEVALLESSNPPTLAHYTGSRAFKVQLRAVARIIQISWSDHIIYEE